MLLTKLHIPVSGDNLVQRLNLFEKLNEGLKRKLILISAPAGFGKTTVVSHWINKYSIPTAWFSIDTNDNDIVDFLSYIISGIQNIDDGFGKRAMEVLKSPTPPSSESIINLLINDIIKIKKDFILILDDFHLINNKEIFKALSYLLEYLPENLHVVILSRSDPNLPIAKIRSQNQLIELRSADLSFSANDISVLFNKKLRTKLSVEDIYSLENKTEGWIAGLQLAALSMQGYDDNSAFINALAGNNRYIMDYLIEEVLNAQEDDVKDFLLKTSLLKQFSAPLCNAILNRNDSQQILEKLENNNMFIYPLDNERHWYRFHHLFADLLKQRLLFNDSSMIEELHNRACEWYEKKQLYNLAIEHALANNNFEKSIQLLGEIVEQMWENGQHAAIIKYGELLPDELIKKNAEFGFYYSWILISAGKIKKAEPFLVGAEQITKNIIREKKISNEELKSNETLLGKIAVAFAYMNSHQEHSEKTFDYCKIAMKNLSEDNPLWYSWAWFSYGVAYFAKGELLESNKAFNCAFEYGKKSGNIYLMSTIVIRMAENEQQLGHYKLAYKKCSDLLSLISDKGLSQITKADWTYAALYFIMGTTQYMWADTEKAFENIKIAYNLCKDGSDVYLKVFVLMVYSIVLKELNDNDAEKRISELDDLIKNNSVPPFLTSFYIGWKTYLLTEKEQIEDANILISEYLEHNKEINYVNEAAYVAYARLLRIQNRLDEAELLLSELYDFASKGKRIERMIEVRVQHAILYNMQRKSNKALSCLMEAIELAANENLLSYFVFIANDIHNVLQEVFKIHATSKTNIPKQFIDDLKAVLEKREKQNRISIDSELSARELDTLKLIAEDLSNQEIADKLFISINTVKSHVKNILLKQETDSRSKAVTKAKKQGII